MGSGQLINGKWVQEKNVSDKKYNRQFREQIYNNKDAIYSAETNRYQLYTTFNSPWGHRAMIARKLKGLEDVIGLSIVDSVVPIKAPGWTFTNNPGCTLDTLNKAKYLHELYTKSDPEFTGRVTVPLLWDKKTKTIINNESADMVNMFNTEFNTFAKYPEVDLYPQKYLSEINAWDERILENINKGVYKCGLASTQNSYDYAYNKLFTTLDEIDSILAKQYYLITNKPVATDWNLFVTLIRFDMVYYSLFRCNKKTISSYPSISAYMHRLYNYPGIIDTINFTHIKRGYLLYLKFPIKQDIVPLGPDLPF